MLLAFAVSWALLLSPMQDPVKPVSHAEYEQFQHCHGDFDGWYVIGLDLLSDDKQQLSEFRDGVGELYALFDELEADLDRPDRGFDAVAGHAAYASGHAVWDDFYERPNADRWFAGATRLGACRSLGNRIIQFLG